MTPRTLVAFHAHPDDEALLSAGTLARAAAAGHRVVLVLATSGDAGLVGDDVLDGAEDLGARRASEAQASADALGVARLVLLGYGDSGSDRPDSATDWPEGSFRAAGVDEAADRLADVLREEGADLLVADDANGGYGHPDHLQVNRVAAAAGRGHRRAVRPGHHRPRVPLRRHRAGPGHGPRGPRRLRPARRVGLVHGPRRHHPHRRRRPRAGGQAGLDGRARHPGHRRARHRAHPRGLPRRCPRRSSPSPSPRSGSSSIRPSGPPRPRSCSPASSPPRRPRSCDGTRRERWRWRGSARARRLEATATPEIPDVLSGLTADESIDPMAVVSHELHRKTTRRRVIEAAISLVVVALIFVFVLPAVTGSHYSEIWHEISKLSTAWLVGLTVVWMLGMLAYTGVLTNSLPGPDPPAGPHGELRRQRGLERGALRRRGRCRRHLRHRPVVGLLDAHGDALDPRVGRVERVRQARHAGDRPGPADRHRPGHRATW